MAQLLTLHFFRWVVVVSAAGVVACSTVPPASPSVSIATTAPKPAAAPAVKADSAIELPVATLSNDAPQTSRYTANTEREPERGGASWYGPRFHGRLTANGERYDMHALTAAHKTLPFGTMVRVKSLVNGREVLVRITDRGPFIRDRIIDLSRAAAAELGMLSLGFKQVVLMVGEGEVVDKPAGVVKRRLGLKR